MPKLHFLSPGLYTTLQDLGRSGYQDKGVPVGGAMDRPSAVLANQLVGNPVGSPVLEMTIKGPVIQIEGPAQLALTGADLSPTLDGTLLPMYESVRLPEGGILRFGRLQAGCRAYLAVRGQWSTKSWLGSVSPPPYQAEWLTPDSPPLKGNCIKVESSSLIPRRFYASYARPDFNPPHQLSMIQGPEYALFDKDFLAWLFHHPHRISPDSNRMGYRLDAAGPQQAWAKKMISSAVIPGTVQVTAGGKVIVLMADAQTTGGYPRLGVLPARELYRLAQVRPGEEVSFY